MKKTIIGFSLAGLLLAGGYATTSFAADTEASAEKKEMRGSHGHGKDGSMKQRVSKEDQTDTSTDSGSL
ncbi:hypothetical protein QUF73_00620 [Cytobacillus sp. NJ13]|nr:hypothetical protein [Cytobacillus sp. NJ13]